MSSGSPDSTGKTRGPLLALDAGVRETGWAIFPARQEILTGIIGFPARRGIDAQVRLTYLVEKLDQLALEWRPRAVAYSQPSGIHWTVPALEQLEASLVEWARVNRLPLFAYTAQEVRTAVAGHPNVSKDQLAYRVMAGLGLIGVSRSAHEWEAIAVGRYHLFRRKTQRGLSKGGGSTKSSEGSD